MHTSLATGTDCTKHVSKTETESEDPKTLSRKKEAGTLKFLDYGMPKKWEHIYTCHPVAKSPESDGFDDYFMTLMLSNTKPEYMPL